MCHNLTYASFEVACVQVMKMAELMQSSRRASIELSDSETKQVVSANAGIASLQASSEAGALGEMVRVRSKSPIDRNTGRRSPISRPTLSPPRRPIVAPVVQVAQPAQSNSSIYWDAKYDGENVIVYDAFGRAMRSFPACLFKGTPDVVKKSNGDHIQVLPDGDAIVINPKSLQKLTSVSDLGWFVKDRILNQNQFEIFTSWQAIYLASTANWSLTDRQADQIYVVPSVKSELYVNRYNSNPIVPLLETLIHLHQEFAGMTLCQIAISVNGRFDPSFNDIVRLMCFLFETFRGEFVSLCRTENTPVYKLHRCNFNLTFDHNCPRTTQVTDIKVMKQLENVFLAPLSRFFSPKTYGDVPWMVWNQKEKDIVEKKAKFLVYPIGFFENSGQIGEMKEAVFFNHVCIFPEISIGDIVYPAGGIIGMAMNKSGRTKVTFRGELFEEISLREEIILTVMFIAFIGKTLDPTEDCSDAFDETRFTAEQIIVRPDFIKAIKNTLFRGH